MLLCAIYVASVWLLGPKIDLCAAVLILRVDLLRGRILLARYLRLYMSDTAGILQSRLGPIGPEQVKTYNVGRHIDWGMCGFGWGAVFRRRCCCGKGVDMVVAEDMGVEERTSLILIGNQETASTSPSPKTSNSTSTSTRHQVGIRHAVQVGTPSGHCFAVQTVSRSHGRIDAASPPLFVFMLRLSCKSRPGIPSPTELYSIPEALTRPPAILPRIHPPY